VKKLLSIGFLLLILTAMFNISVATHFCGGKVVASTVSLTGKLASCGMESSEKSTPVSGTSFNSHCCDDFVTYYGTDYNYTLSLSFLPDSYPHNFQLFSIHSSYQVHTPAVFRLYSDTSPPWALMSTKVDLSAICSYRI
jgi:hypothetical protein